MRKTCQRKSSFASLIEEIRINQTEWQMNHRICDVVENQADERD